MSPALPTPQQIYGTWRLIEAKAVDSQGNPTQPPYGPIPMGRIVFTPSGRMMAVICDGRPAMPEGEKRGYASYCGNFQLEGDKLITTVDAALIPERIGGKQIRKVEFRQGRLVLIPPARADGEQRELVWERDGSA